MKNKVILTGATGYIGRHVLAELLARGYHVAAIVRKRSGSVDGRLPASAGALQVVEGDVTRPLCGIAEAEFAEIAERATVFIHCAGLTQFDAHLEKELHLQNVEGTRNALTLARKMGIRHFHHVSTAFVDPGPGHTFKNPYERSKSEAEEFLKNTDAGSMAISVYRPSIVVGGRVLGENGSAGTIYAYIKSLRFVRECFRKDARTKNALSSKYGVSRSGNVWNIPLRVEGDPCVRVNLVHVLDVASRILENVETPPPHGGVYGLASQRTFQASELKEAFCRALGIRGVEWVPAATLEKGATILEQKFRKMTRPYREYLFHMPSFEGAKRMREVSLEAVADDFLKELEARENGQSLTLGSLAMDCLDAEKPGRYLDKFSSGDFGESLLRRIPFADAKVNFRITGAGAVARTLYFEKGKVRALDGAEASADFSYELDEATFNGIVAGQLDPREAFFKGLLKISGDQEQALKFGFIFTEHFRLIDERILEELEGKSA